MDSRVVHVTTNPNGPWVTQVAHNFAADLEEAGRGFRFLIRDRDTKFTRSFDEVFTSIGVQTIRTPVRSPRANAYAERFVRTATSCRSAAAAFGTSTLLDGRTMISEIAATQASPNAPQIAITRGGRRLHRTSS